MMTKKKKKRSQKPSPPPDPCSFSPSGLEAPIHEHSLFFDRLVDLIPARFYLPPPDGDDRPWFLGLSKHARASAKKQTRENTKKSRRARLDPERSSSTLDVLKMRVEADKPKPDPAAGSGSGTGTGDAPPGSEDAPAAPATAAADRSVTYEELRERLRRRIEELRSTRNTRTPGERKARGKEKGGSGLGKRKREAESVEESGGKKHERADEKQRDASAVELSFGYVKLGDGYVKMGKKKRKKLSKLQALEKAKRLAAAKMDPEKGDVVSRKHSWKAAISRAAGVKVHDDPKLLKESMKKEKKRHQKNVEKWKERVETRDKLRVEKQKTRADNIQERSQQKKMRKIEKREKKLMRPGFEGRKEGYINAT